MELEQKIAIVVGGGGEIGRATALRLAKEGCQLVLASRNLTNLNAVAQEIKNSGHEAIAIQADVTDPNSVKKMVETAVIKFGTVHILVNSIASPTVGSFLELSDEDWANTLQVKYLGSVRTMREVLPYMIKQEYGRIVNISGTGGIEPSSLHLPGGSANAAMNLLSKGLAREMAKYNIKINVVAPGPVTSKRFMKLLKARAAEKRTTLNTEIEAMTKQMPLGRLATPEEIAEVIAFLIGEKSSFIYGACIIIDGAESRSI